MGRARIIGEVGNGLYTIQVKHDTTVADSQLSTLNKILSQVEARIAEEQGKNEPNQSVIAALVLRKTALEKRIDAITEARDADYQTEAWCADLTEGLTGEVGTIEPGTEYKNGINIQPGYDGQAAWSASRDGQATPFLTMDVADAMRNFAAMPAIQKHRPTYRYGTISNIDTNAKTCHVEIDVTISNIQHLDLNLKPTLSGVPIEYMNCNAGAFNDGDAVIVAFEGFSHTKPKVIGFKSNPRGCAYALKINTLNGVVFPNKYTSYQLCLMQPIARTVDAGPIKGTYTEDHTVIGEADVDKVGVAVIQIKTETPVDADSPLYIGIKNTEKWRYYTTDWRGSVPDQGVKFSKNQRDDWVHYPTDDLGQYDFLLDYVQWMRTDIDLRLTDTTTFQNENGDKICGYEIDIVGIKLLRLDHRRYYLTTLDCNNGHTVWPDNNYDSHDYKILTSVPPDLNYNLWYAHFYYLTRPIECFKTTDTFICREGDNGQAYRIYIPDDYTAETGTKVLTMGTPAILSDRLGQNLYFTSCKAELCVENTYRCQWIWMEDLGGYFCTNWINNTKRWSNTACEPGLGVEENGNVCELNEFVSCGDAMAETGEYMTYEVVNLDAEYV